MKPRKLFILGMLVFLISPAFSQGPDDPDGGDPDAAVPLGNVEILMCLGLAYGIGKLVQKQVRVSPIQYWQSLQRDTKRCRTQEVEPES